MQHLHTVTVTCSGSDIAHNNIYTQQHLHPSIVAAFTNSNIIYNDRQLLTVLATCI